MPKLNLATEEDQDWVNAEIIDPKIFAFPSGMAGFSYAKEFVFLCETGDVACMHCTEHPEAAFLVTGWDESRLGKPPALKQEERVLLELAEHEHPLWLLVLNPFSDQEWVFANLKAPIAINESQLRGVQCIQVDTETQLMRYHWMRQPSQAKA